MTQNVVRRRDKRGRTYHFNKATGKRTSERAWKISRSLAKRGATERQAKAALVKAALEVPRGGKVAREPRGDDEDEDLVTMDFNIAVYEEDD